MILNKFKLTRNSNKKEQKQNKEIKKRNGTGYFGTGACSAKLKNLILAIPGTHPFITKPLKLTNQGVHSKYMFIPTKKIKHPTINLIWIIMKSKVK